MRSRGSTRRWLPSVVLIAMAFLALAAAARTGITPSLGLDSAAVPPSAGDSTACVGDLEGSLACHREHYRQLTLDSGVDAAFAELRAGYATSAGTRAECHQLTHAIGRASTERNGTLAGAFTIGDPLCSAGYFHGAAEAMVAKLGVDRVLANPDAVCADLGEHPRRSIYHRNCAHGIGHGFMLIYENELPHALAGCDSLADDWERESCYGGVFMENVTSRHDPDHPSKYLRAEEPLFPCTDLDVRYQRMCYQKQTAYPLALSDADFGQVFSLCATVENAVRPFCFQGLGTSAAVFTILHVAEEADRATLTAPLCLLGQDDEAQSNCAVGAVRAMLNNYFGDTQAKAFCAALPANLRDICLSTANDRLTWPD
jgi:hypothetical protein